MVDFIYYLSSEFKGFSLYYYGILKDFTFIYIYLFLTIAILIITGSIYFILLDELIIGSVQRRIGPLNLGWYGILSSIINGCKFFHFLITN